MLLSGFFLGPPGFFSFCELGIAGNNRLVVSKKSVEGDPKFEEERLPGLNIGWNEKDHGYLFIAKQKMNQTFQDPSLEAPVAYHRGFEDEERIHQREAYEER